MIVKALVTAGLALFATSALAAVEFRNAGAIVNAEGDLVVAFAEIGLPKGTDINITIRAVARAGYACQNNGGNFPGSVEVEREVMTNDLVLNTGIRRRISGGTVFNPPASELSCPGGQTVTLVCVTYTRVRIDDTTTPRFVRLGSIARNFFPEDFPICAEVPAAPSANGEE